MPPPDSLPAWLARQPEADLVELLFVRPDLAVPPPADSGVLATRAALRASVARAADELDAFVLAVWQVLVTSGADARTVPVAEVTEQVEAPVEYVTAAMAVLRARALAWGPDEDMLGIRVSAAAREVLHRPPAQLGRPSPHLDGVDVPALLAELDDDRLALLTTLANGAPLGRTRDAAVDAPADRPVPRLLAAGLLLKVDEQTVELPSQVGTVLRHHPRADAAVSTEPAPEPTRWRPDEVDSTAAGEALELLRHAGDLLEALGAGPAPVLRSGGIGVREVRRLAKHTQLSETRVALVLELLVGAGLVATGTLGGVTEFWAPSAAVDAWLPGDPALRWAELARSWLELPRLPALIGRRDDRDKPLVALSEELRSVSAPRDRRRVLGVLADAPPGAALTAADVESVLAWRLPRWGGRARRDLIGWTLAEAAAVGVLGRGALSAAGRALLVAPATAAAVMAGALPEPLDHVLVQADLTVVAPGPLQPELEREIGLVADVESAGAATVYRVSPGSVRRALDAGRSAGELHALFAQRSRTPVPQALTYLIDDIARRHGRLRAGTAAAFVRCDDEALLSEVLVSAVAAELGLRRLAPTVAVSPAPLAELLDRLRAAGFSPAGEDAAGDVLDLRAAGARVPARRPRRASTLVGPPALAQREAVVRGVRAGDRAARMIPSNLLVTDGTRTTGVATMAVLQQAARAQRSVWIGYVDAQGVASQRVVDPINVSGGVLEAFDPAPAELRRFALHRITSVALAQP